MNESPQTMHSKIVRNVSLLSLSVGITMVIALVLRTMLPRILGPEKMGIFYFAESQATFYFAFMSLGLTTYINRTVPADHGHPREVFSTMLIVEIVAALLIGVVLYATLLATGKDAETIGTTLLMGSFAAVFGFQRHILQKIFISIDRVSLVSQLNILVKVILVVGCVAILLLHPSVVWIAGMHAIAELLGLLILLRFAKKMAFLTATPSLQRVRRLLKSSLPFYMAGVLTTVYSEIDTNMLGYLSNNTEVAYYGAAYKLIGVFMLMVPILQNSFTPSLSQTWAAQDGSFEVLFKELVHVLLIGTLPLTVVLILFGDKISGLLYGPGFEASYKVLCFLTPVLIMMYLNTFAGMSLHLISPGGQISRIFIVGILINIALDWLVIPIGLQWGPGGAGIAVSFCTFACETYTFLAMLYIFPSKVLDLKLFKNLIVILMPCWVAMYFYDSIIQLDLLQRFGLACLSPFYAFGTKLLLPKDIKQFIALLKTMRRNKQRV